MRESLAVRIGNFFFRYRNRAFPVIIIALYAAAAPPSEIFGSEFLEHCKDAVAVAIAVLGLALRASVIGFAYIKRGGRGKRVYANDLVTEGMFGLCRNPLYVGNLLICVGTFLLHGNPYVLVIGTASYVLIYRCIVSAEEAYLNEKFGAAYAAYCADVPRWIPVWSRFKEATDDLAFDFRRVIFKDYTTIATTITLLVVTEFYEEIAKPGSWRAEMPQLLLLGAIALSAGFMVAVVKALKNTKAGSS